MNAPNEEDLHAYADGALADARRIEIEAWLAGHPDDARRVRDWSAQNQALHAAYDDVLNEPLPLALVRAARHRPAWRAWQRAAVVAAAVTSFAATGLGGYGLGRLHAPERLVEAPLARDAALAHAVYTPEVKHPVEVDAQHAEHLVAWLSKRLGTPLKAPDFSTQGFALLGGRLLPGSDGAVAQFMYEDAASRRITLYVRRQADDSRQTGFSHAREHGVEVFYWIDGHFGYALSGRIAPAEMNRLADLGYRLLTQSDVPAPAPPHVE